MKDKEVQPSFAGMTTFFRTSPLEKSEIEKGHVVITAAPFDTTGGARVGARFGPRAIRESSVHLRYYMESSPGDQVVDLDTGDTLFMPGSDFYDLGDIQVYPASVKDTAQSIEKGISEIANKASFIAMMGGDHYVTYPGIKGFIKGLSGTLKKAPEDLKIGYIQLDGHFDLAGENYLYGKHFHGATARLISALPSVSLENMVWVGPKGYVRKEQADFIYRNNLNYFTVKDIQREGIEDIIQKAVSIASYGVDAVYASIDIDIVDISQAPGSSAIQFGGIGAVDLLKAVNILKHNEKIKMVDLVEVAPNLDPTERTQRLAAQVLFELVSTKAGIG